MSERSAPNSYKLPFLARNTRKIKKKKFRNSLPKMGMLTKFEIFQMIKSKVLGFQTQKSQIQILNQILSTFRSEQCSIPK